MKKMDYYLDLCVLPKYYTGAFREFEENECHVDRRPNYSVLLCLLDGVLVFYEDGKRIEVAKNEWYIQRAGCLQQGRFPSLCPKYFYIHFFGEYRQEDGEGRTNDRMPLRGRFYPSAIFDQLQKLEKLERDGEFFYLEQQSVFYAVLNQLQKNYGEKDQNDYSVASKIAEYIGSHFSEELRVPQMADHFNYSADYFIRIFKKRFQMTPHQYLTSVRLREAKRLLLSTDWPLEQITSVSGFGEITAFYRAFKKSEGISPGHWRRQIQGIEQD